MLFNEPKLLKLRACVGTIERSNGFSALQRAEIAEINVVLPAAGVFQQVSVLFNEPKLLKSLNTIFGTDAIRGFSALQRAEIAEIRRVSEYVAALSEVSVLFNEPKLLKYISGLYNALLAIEFQCSSTSRNC